MRSAGELLRKVESSKNTCLISQLSASESRLDGGEHVTFLVRVELRIGNFFSGALK